MKKILRFLIALAVPCLCANVTDGPLFLDGFENANPFAGWEIISPDPVETWALVETRTASSGAKCLRLVPGNLHILIKRTLMPVHAASVAKGFYFSFDFKIDKASITAGPSGPLWGTLLSCVMSGSWPLYGNPTVLIEKQGSDIFLKMLMRQKHGDMPLTIPPDPVVRVAPDRWHALSVFVSIRDSVLIDSLFYDDRCIGAGTRRFIVMPAMIEKIELGQERKDGLPVSSICFDNVSISAKRTVNTQPANLMTLRPDRGNNPVFSVGDTLYLDFIVNPMTRNDYIDLNFRLTSFEGSKLDRYGVLDKKRNLVFSLYDSARVPYKDQEGLNSWGAVSKDAIALRSYPFTTLLMDAYYFNPRNGEGTIALRINKDFEPGRWEINACMVHTGQSNDAQVLPSLSFYIKPRYPKLRLLIGLAAGLISLVIVSMVYTRRSVVKDTALKGDLSDIVLKIDDFLANNYANNDLSHEDIAKHVFLSKPHTNMLYKRSQGISPMQKLRDIRMQKACELLLSTEKSISDIGFAVGFQDQNNFLRSFKKSIGFSPSDYRKTRKNQPR